MSDMGNITPCLRFKGYNDVWDQSKLSDLATFSKGQGYSRGDLSEQGYPVVLYGRLYTNYQTVISVVDTFVAEIRGSIYSTGCEVLVPASGETAEDISRASAIIKSGILIGGDLNIVYPSDEIEPIFLALTISYGHTKRALSQKAQGKSVVHLHSNDFKDISIPYPSKAEQKKISLFFELFDNLISIHQRKCERLMEVKKSLLEKMFPAEGESVPKIHFNGYVDAWRQCYVKDVCTIGTGKSNTQDQVEDGPYPFYIRSETPVRSNKYLYDCEAIITIGDGNIGKVFHYVNGKFDLHQRCYKMTNFKDIYGKYFYHYFSDKFYTRAIRMTAKTSVDSVRLAMIADMEIYKPNDIEEQRNIALILDKMDNLIMLHHCTLEKLNNIKKSLLERMFV